MMRRKNRVEPIPENFVSYDAAANFWQKHDTTQYPNDFRTVKVVTELRGRHYEIEIASDLARALCARARRAGVTLGHLANRLLRQRLQKSG